MPRALTPPPLRGQRPLFSTLKILSSEIELTWVKPFARRAPHPEQSLATLTEAMYRPSTWRRRLSESFTLTEGAVSMREVRIECSPPCVLASELGLEGLKDQILVPVAIAKKFMHLAFQVKITDGKGDELPSLEHKKSNEIALKILHYTAKKSSVKITDSELEQLIDLQLTQNDSLDPEKYRSQLMRIHEKCGDDERLEHLVRMFLCHWIKFTILPKEEAGKEIILGYTCHYEWRTRPERPPCEERDLENNETNPNSLTKRRRPQVVRTTPSAGSVADLHPVDRGYGPAAGSFRRLNPTRSCRIQPTEGKACERCCRTDNHFTSHHHGMRQCGTFGYGEWPEDCGQHVWPDMVPNLGDGFEEIPSSSSPRFSITPGAKG